MNRLGTFLQGEKAERAVFLGEDGLFARSPRETLLVGCGTVTVQFARELHEAAAARAGSPPSARQAALHEASRNLPAGEAALLHRRPGERRAGGGGQGHAGDHVRRRAGRV